MIATCRQENRAIAISLRHFKSQHSLVKRQGAIKISDFEVDVPYIDSRIDWLAHKLKCNPKFTLASIAIMKQDYFPRNLIKLWQDTSLRFIILTITIRLSQRMKRCPTRLTYSTKK